MYNWQGDVEKIIISGLRAKKDEDEILVALGNKGFALSAVQYSYYRKKAMFLLKSNKKVRK